LIPKRPFAVAVLVAAALLPAPLAAQDDYTFTAGLLGGFGGSFDDSSDADLDHRAVEAAVGMVTNDRTLTMVRFGQLEFDSDLEVEGLRDAELTFLTIAGEYRFRQPSYDFGIYLGLGGYELAGEDFFAGEVDDRGLGLALGFTGDFDLTRRLSVVVELSAHYAFLDRADLYGLALGGLAVHF
jgi:hypothetical protein